MFTGDFPAHDVWLQSKQNNIEHGKVATDLVKKYFPASVVLPNIGNHEPWPCNRFGCIFITQIIFMIIYIYHITYTYIMTVNLFSMAIPSVKEPEFSASWIYDYLSEQFSTWLPEEAKVTFADSGFYTYKLLPGLRIVSLNSILNLGYNL